MKNIENVLMEGMKETGIPEYMRDGLLSYVLHGLPPGGFLKAVLANDLKGAVNRADMNNLNAIERYVDFLHKYAPSDCWGNLGKVNSWFEKCGLYETR